MAFSLKHSETEPTLSTECEQTTVLMFCQRRPFFVLQRYGVSMLPVVSHNTTLYFFLETIAPYTCVSSAMRCISTPEFAKLHKFS